MIDYIIKNLIGVEGDAETYIISGESNLDAINKFDKRIREKDEQVSFITMSNPSGRWIFCVDTMVKDKLYRPKSYEIYPKEETQ